MQKIKITEGLEGELFTDSDVGSALKSAQAYSEKGGIVAPLPLLLNIPPKEILESHRHIFTANTEEIYGTDKKGNCLR